MRVALFTLVFALLYSGCSVKTKYVWKINGNAYFEKYQINLFKGDYFKARYYLKYALKEAQNSSDVQDLATMYLSDCAMQRALLTNVSCTEYDALDHVVKNATLRAYKKFLFVQEVNGDDLPKRYMKIHSSIVNKDAPALLKEIKALDTIYSKAIAASVGLRNGVKSLALIDEMINSASLYGYKALMLVWMKEKVIWFNQHYRTDEAQEVQAFIDAITKEL